MSIKTLALATALIATPAVAQQVIGKVSPKLGSDLLTPEVLWSFGRIGSVNVSPNDNKAVYTVSYFSKEQNKSHSVLYAMALSNKASKLLTASSYNERGGVFVNQGKSIIFLSNASGSSQLWMMNADGSNRQQISHEKTDVNDFLVSPDNKKIIMIMDVPQHHSIQENDKDLPKASGMVINDLMYKHWDHYVTTAPHPYVADLNALGITNPIDLLAGEPYECPMEPFGGAEQLAWSPDSKQIVYTSRKKVGLKYAISTDSDIYLYDLTSRKTVNLCKPSDYKEPESTPTQSLQAQAVNHQQSDFNVGYDQNPQFSPDGRYVAWLSMARDGYESDRSRLCVYELSTGKKQYVTESFESSVNDFLWSSNSKDIYFTGVWHGVANIYATNLKGSVKKLINDIADYSLVSLSPSNKGLIAKKHSMSQADELYEVGFNGKVSQLTFENKAFYDQLTFGEVKERWVKTIDGKEEQCWVIYPPHFDPSQKYPTLLYCEGGPQSPISQFWSYRWNFQIMAAHGYIVIAPNRRGLPGYGMEWLEEISGDYTGLCMQDYLSAIDDIAKESYVDKDHLGAVGASFGGFSVYWLAGHHEGRFKALIAHDGIFNTQQQYLETEEMWFANWDLGSAPWVKDNNQMKKAFAQSPHLFVDKWTAPILCIHGQRDFRIEYTQAESAFAAAKLRGIPAQMLLLPDENHWVLKPQNGILWQRTFFRWLDKWLKN
ncbi:S9 family peptidase [Alloprevotella tannerae]|uniref:Peptidase, S9A/B/C family, catalytic domain protein n=1 Tax=Alloprevotella tannerae ATCC 51259 TaxID=626522 RepID=C9LKN4_9BACT|nr:S9 family peptidase [Alloprevotella tannerae]EEX70350.1 peptidase, S9A/B/C family, catalytic domain protein [Alloprevotella tannerae ATCC 51259]